MNKMKSLFAASALLLAINAMAAGGGLDKGTSFVQKLVDFLTSGPLAIGVITLCIAIAGYKVAFGGQTVREVAPIVIGGVIIGSAAYIAGLIIN